MRKQFKSFVFLFITATAFLFFSKDASAKEALRIPQWEVEAYLQDNGDLQITEDITFEFNDEFNGVFRDIILNKTSGIAGITVQELEDNSLTDYTYTEDAKNGASGLYTLQEDKNKLLIKIYSPSKDERKTYRISYLVKNVAVSYNDIGELYYKFLGEENKTPIDNFVININLPATASDKDIKIYAHGPSNGVISKERDSVYQLQVYQVPSETFIEGRVLFPKSFIASSTNQQSIDKYNDIIQEEASFANKLVEDKSKKEAIQRLLGRMSILISGVFFLMFAVLLVRNRRVNHQEGYQSSSGIPQECTPAIAELITGGMLGTNAIIATLLDLVRKGYLRLNEEQQSAGRSDESTYQIYKERESDDLLLKQERYFISWLINEVGDGLSVSTKDIEYYSKHSNPKFISSYTNWKNKVKEDAQQLGYYDSNRPKQGTLLLLFSLPVFVLGIFTAVSGSVQAIFAFGAAGLFFTYGLILLFSLSDYGYSQYCRWMAFRKYWKTHNPDLSSEEVLRSPDPSLIYALGLNVIKKQRLPERMDDDDIINSWFFWYILFVSSDNNTFRKSIDSSFHTVDVSSASGDSFSGGGGDGAGGGGAGGF